VAEREQRTLAGHHAEILLEIDNILTGLRWAVEHEMVSEIKKQLLSMWVIFEYSGREFEGEAELEMIVDGLRSDTPHGEKGVAYGLALSILGLFIMRTDFYSSRWIQYLKDSQNILSDLNAPAELAYSNANLARFPETIEYEDAVPLFQQSLDLYEKLNSSWGIAYTHLSWGNRAVLSHQLGDAESHYMEGYRVGSPLYDVHKAWYLSGLGYLALKKGELERAKDFLEKAFLAGDSTDNKQYASQWLMHLGDLAIAMGQLDEAQKRHEAALEIRQKMGNQDGIATSKADLGVVALAKGEYELAEDLFTAALGIFSDLGNEGAIAMIDRYFGDLALALDDLLEAAIKYRDSLSIQFEHKLQTGSLLTLKSVARLWARYIEKLSKSVELTAFVHHHPEMWELSLVETENSLTDLRERLPESEFEKAVEAGRSRELWETVEEVLKGLEGLIEGT
jgi:tetratricopeptide (TPR) repeat protein